LVSSDQVITEVLVEQIKELKSLLFRRIVAFGSQPPTCFLLQISMGAEPQLPSRSGNFAIVPAKAIAQLTLT